MEPNCTFRIFKFLDVCNYVVHRINQKHKFFERSPLTWIKFEKTLFTMLQSEGLIIQMYYKKGFTIYAILIQSLCQIEETMSSLCETLSSIDRILLLYLKCMSLDRLRGIVLATTLETDLVVSGRKSTCLRDTSTKGDISKPKHDNHEIKCGHCNRVAKKYKIP